MHKIIIVLILIVLNTFFAYTQDSTSLYIPYRKGNKWGLCNKNGKVLVKPRYDYMKENIYHSSDIILVGMGGKLKKDNQYYYYEGRKYGYINIKGQEIIPVEYDELRDGIDYYSLYKESQVDLIWASKNEKWSLLSKTGEIIIPLASKGAEISHKDSIISIHSEKERNIQLYSLKTGKEIKVPSQKDELYNYGNGIVIFFNKDRITGYGIVNSDHTEVVRLTKKYNEVDKVVNGFARVKVAGYNEKNKWKDYEGVIDQTGKEVVPAKYRIQPGDIIGRHQLVIASNGKKYGLMNTKGEFIIPLQYDYINNEGDFYEIRLKDKLGYINKEGKEIIALKYSQNRSERILWTTYPNEGFIILELNGKMGVMNTHGEIVIPFIYDEFASISSFSSYDYFITCGLIWAKRNRRWALVNQQGKEIIPPSYDEVEIGYYSEIYDDNRGFEVALNNKWGYVNKKGKEIAFPKYDWVSEYDYNGFTIVKANNNCILLKDGKEITYFPYDEVYLGDNYVTIERYGKFGLATLQGREIISPQYDQLYTFDDSIYVAKINYKWAFLDLSGKNLSGFIYDNISYCAGAEQKSKIKYKVVIDGKCGYSDKKGNIIVPIKYRNMEMYTKDVGLWKIRDGFIYAYTEEGDMGLFDKDGNLILPVEYKEIDAVSKEIVRVVNKNNQVGFINVKTGMNYFKD